MSARTDSPTVRFTVIFFKLVWRFLNRLYTILIPTPPRIFLSMYLEFLFSDKNSLFYLKNLRLAPNAEKYYGEIGLFVKFYFFEIHMFILLKFIWFRKLKFFNEKNPDISVLLSLTWASDTRKVHWRFSWKTSLCVSYILI